VVRVQGWELFLVEAIEKARKEPFQWGVHDCATWSFDVRFVLTDEDSASIWRGKYKTEAGAAKMLRKLKCKTVEDLALSILGLPLPNVLFAQRGDMVIGGEERALGICIGSDSLFLLPSGWTSLPTETCSKAWKV